MEIFIALITGSSKVFTSAASTPYSSPILSAVSTLASRTCAKSASLRKNTSRVIQKGPAFFDRTTGAISPSVRASSLMGHVGEGGPEHVLPFLDRDNMVEHELIRRSALDLRR